MQNFELDTDLINIYQFWMVTFAFPLKLTTSRINASMYFSYLASAWIRTWHALLPTSALTQILAQASYVFSCASLVHLRSYNACSIADIQTPCSTCMLPKRTVNSILYWRKHSTWKKFKSNTPSWLWHASFTKTCSARCVCMGQTNPGRKIHWYTFQKVCQVNRRTYYTEIS